MKSTGLIYVKFKDPFHKLMRRMIHFKSDAVGLYHNETYFIVDCYTGRIVRSIKKIGLKGDLQEEIHSLKYLHTSDANIKNKIVISLTNILARNTMRMGDEDIIISSCLRSLFIKTFGIGDHSPENGYMVIGNIICDILSIPHDDEYRFISNTSIFEGFIKVKGSPEKYSEHGFFKEDYHMVFDIMKDMFVNDPDFQMYFLSRFTETEEKKEFHELKDLDLNSMENCVSIINKHRKLLGMKLLTLKYKAKNLEKLNSSIEKIKIQLNGAIRSMTNGVHSVLRIDDLANCFNTIVSFFKNTEINLSNVKHGSYPCILLVSSDNSNINIFLNNKNVVIPMYGFNMKILPDEMLQSLLYYLESMPHHETRLESLKIEVFNEMKIRKYAN